MNSRVLLIDDNVAVHRLVEVWLRSLDVEFSAVSGDEESVQTVQNWKPDVILLDINLDGSDGFELCRRLKDQPAIANTPIVFLTAESRVEEKVRGLDLGATDYITKPFHPAELQARVRVALRTKYLMDLLSDRAQIDGLTGLHNHAFMDERLQSEISQSKRYGLPLSCILMDIDHFKKVNDTFGHTVGDEVLRHAASALTRRCRREDIVCRWGGEEFAILTPNVGLSGAITLAEDLRQLMATLEIKHAGKTIPITCSFGVAEYVTDEKLPLAERADEALYFAKRTGRNRVCPEMRIRALTARAG